MKIVEEIFEIAPKKVAENMPNTNGSRKKPLKHLKSLRLGSGSGKVRRAKPLEILEQGERMRKPGIMIRQTKVEWQENEGPSQPRRTNRDERVRTAMTCDLPI